VIILTIFISIINLIITVIIVLRTVIAQHQGGRAHFTVMNLSLYEHRAQGFSARSQVKFETAEVAGRNEKSGRRQLQMYAEKQWRSRAETPGEAPARTTERRSMRKRAPPPRLYRAKGLVACSNGNEEVGRSVL